jgi:hypothetical protein
MKRKNKGGNPPLYGKAMPRFLVTLDPMTVRKARKLGAGNLSRGIRKGFTLIPVDDP